MEKKKNPSKEIDKYEAVFVETGIAITLLLVLSAFSWKSEQPLVPLGSPIEVEAEWDVSSPITFIEQKKKPKLEIVKPKPKTPTTFEITVVDDKKVLEVLDTAIFRMTLPNIDDIGYKEVDTLPEPPIDPWALTQMPEFPGGEAALFKFLRDNIKYPSFEQAMQVGGKVTLKLAVNEKGEVEQVEVLKGVTANLDAEALRVVRKMPDWQPGKQGSKKVTCWFILPIVFKAN